MKKGGQKEKKQKEGEEEERMKNISEIEFWPALPYPVSGDIKQTFSHFEPRRARVGGGKGKQFYKLSTFFIFFFLGYCKCNETFPVDTTDKLILAE